LVKCEAKGANKLLFVFLEKLLLYTNNKKSLNIPKGFLRFSSPIKLTSGYNRNVVEGGVKHHNPPH
jgi:hypothetical protein